MENKVCPGCGTPIKEGCSFCAECGKPVNPQNKRVSTPEVSDSEKKSSPIMPPPPAHPHANTQGTRQAPGPQYPPQDQAAPQYNGQYQQYPPQGGQYQNQGYYAPPQYIPDVKPAPGSAYELISAWGFFGIQLLLALPIIGPILTIIWACGGCRKVQLQSYARGRILVALFYLVLTIIFLLLFGSMFALILEEASGGYSSSYWYS